MTKTIKAVVQRIVDDGKHGRYAHATTEDPERVSVSFALDPPVWREKGTPEPGVFVVLSDLRRKRAGWRAMSARFWNLEDEQQQAKGKS